MTTNNIILFPDFEQLRTDVQHLRETLSSSLLERDELQLVICRNLEMHYMLTFGSLEYRLYEAQCTILRLKRKIEYIQQAINRQEPIHLATIDHQLDQEFITYEQLLNEKIDQINAAIERKNAPKLSKEDTVQIKKFYRIIVKELHPDLHPEQTEAQLKLFKNAVVAYHNGDVDTLQTIFELLDDSVLEPHEDALTHLRKEQKRLMHLVATVQQTIATIKQQFPYTERELLNDAQQIAQRKAELERVIQQYVDLIAVYQHTIEEMVGAQ